MSQVPRWRIKMLSSVTSARTWLTTYLDHQIPTATSRCLQGIDRPPSEK